MSHNFATVNPRTLTSHLFYYAKHILSACLTILLWWVWGYRSSIWLMWYHWHEFLSKLEEWAIINKFYYLIAPMLHTSNICRNFQHSPRSLHLVLWSLYKIQGRSFYLKNRRKTGSVDKKSPRMAQDICSVLKHRQMKIFCKNNKSSTEFFAAGPVLEFPYSKYLPPAHPPQIQEKAVRWQLLSHIFIYLITMGEALLVSNETVELRRRASETLCWLLTRSW